MAIVQPANFGDILRNAPDVMSGNRFERVAAQNQAAAQGIFTTMADINATMAFQEAKARNDLQLQRAGQRFALAARLQDSLAANNAFFNRKAGEAIAQATGQDPMAALAAQLDGTTNVINSLGAFRQQVEGWSPFGRIGVQSALAPNA